MRLLFVPTFVEPDLPGLTEASSDSIGYGATTAGVIRGALAGVGHEVVLAAAPAECPRSRWVPAILDSVGRHLEDDRVDAVLAFHSFTPFAADIRRILDDLGVDVPLITWTHGSHWDPTDLFRFEHHPHLRWADLGNMLAADRVLVPSRYMYETIVSNVGEASPSAAGELRRRLRVVGLPVDIPRIVLGGRRTPSDLPTVVFNHALIPAKRPDVFLSLLPEVFAAVDCRVVLTRASRDDVRYGSLLRRLLERFPAQVCLGGHLRIRDYYALLWEASVQVSTATHEGFGVATLEAMATYNYCCVPRTGAYPELLGSVSEPLFDSEEEVPDKIARALLDKPLRDRTAQALARRAGAFSPAAVAADLMRVIEEVI